MSIVVLLEIQVKPEALDEMKAFIKKIRKRSQGVKFTSH
jgi:hypothetical protein